MLDRSCDTKNCVMKTTIVIESYRRTLIKRRGTREAQCASCERKSDEAGEILRQAEAGEIHFLDADSGDHGDARMSPHTAGRDKRKKS